MLSKTNLNLKIIKFNELILGYDIGTMEIFQMDQVTFDLLATLEANSYAEGHRILIEKYPIEVISKKIEEIEEGIQAGFISTKESFEESHGLEFMNGEINQVELVVGKYAPAGSNTILSKLTENEAKEVVDWVLEENYVLNLLVKFVGEIDLETINLIANLTEYLAKRQDDIEYTFSIELEPKDLISDRLIKLIYKKNFFVTIKISDECLNDPNVMDKIAFFNCNMDDRKSYIVSTDSTDLEKIIDLLNYYGLTNYWIELKEDISIDHLADQSQQIVKQVLEEYLLSKKSPRLRYIRETMSRLGTRGGPKIYGCSAGRNRLTFYGGKKILPCKRFIDHEQFHMGEVPDLNRQIQRSFLQNTCQKKNKCQECWCKLICGGGCDFNYFTTKGSSMCEMIKELSEVAIILYGLMLWGKDPCLDEILLQDV